MRSRRSRDAAHELLLLQIGVHGPSVIYEHLALLRWLWANERITFLEVKAALREAGMPDCDVWSAVHGQAHLQDCVCWVCVGKLHLEILRELTVRGIPRYQE